MNVVQKNRPGNWVSAIRLGRLALGCVLGPWLLASTGTLARAQAPAGPDESPPRITSTSQIPPAPIGDPGTLARAKLRQARGLFERGRLDDAQRVAGEANGWKVQYGPGEDTPIKLLD